MWTTLQAFVSVLEVNNCVSDRFIGSYIASKLVMSTHNVDENKTYRIV